MSLALAALLVSRFFWEPYVIPSGSMKPTLWVNDYIAVVPTRGNIERGDVLVVAHPTRNQAFVVRLIGLPGERIQLVDGVLNIDGTPVTRTPTSDFVEVMQPQGPLQLLPRCANGPIGRGQECTKMRFVETLPNGVTYEVLDIGQQESDFTGVFEVPPNTYFFLGDNRDNSNDSRNTSDVGGLGFLPGDAVIGEVSRIVLPSWSERRWWVTALTDERFMERVR